jgi:hypothetical protein
LEPTTPLLRVKTKLIGTSDKDELKTSRISNNSPSHSKSLFVKRMTMSKNKNKSKEKEDISEFG